MRITVLFETNKNEIPKDKNKLIVSWIKYFMKSYDKDLFNKLYNSGPVEKDYTYSIYLGNAVFGRESIKIQENKFKMYFSVYDLEESIHFYNIFISSVGKFYEYKDIKICAKKLIVEKDIKFKEEFAFFKTASPIIVREHSGDNSKTYYHDISTQNGMDRLKKNILYRLTKKFGETVRFDTNIEIDIISQKMVTVRHNGLNIPSNLATLKISAKPYILEYIYFSGVLSSYNASGYGMLSVIN